MLPWHSDDNNTRHTLDLQHWRSKRTDNICPYRENQRGLSNTFSTKLLLKQQNFEEEESSVWWTDTRQADVSVCFCLSEDRTVSRRREDSERSDSRHLCAFLRDYLLFIVAKHKAGPNDPAPELREELLRPGPIAARLHPPLTQSIVRCSIVFWLWLMGLVHCHLAADRSHKSLPQNTGLLPSLCICTQYQPLHAHSHTHTRTENLTDLSSQKPV